MTSLVFQRSAIVIASGSNVRRMSSQGNRAIPNGENRFKLLRQLRNASETGLQRGQEQQSQEQRMIERSELPRFVAQSFIRQHGAEAQQHGVQVEKKKPG